MVQGQVGIGQGLGLYALGGIHHQHRTLTGGQGAGDLIIEVHMARGVDEVQGIGLAVFRFIIKVDGSGFDGDAPLALQVHVVQELVLHLPLGHGVT